MELLIECEKRNNFDKVLKIFIHTFTKLKPHKTFKKSHVSSCSKIVKYACDVTCEFNALLKLMACEITTL